MIKKRLESHTYHLKKIFIPAIFLLLDQNVGLFALELLVEMDR